MERSPYIDRVKQQQKEQETLYRDATVHGGLSDILLWGLYTLMTAGRACL